MKPGKREENFLENNIDPRHTDRSKKLKKSLKKFTERIYKRTERMDSIRKQNAEAKCKRSRIYDPDLTIENKKRKKY